MASLDISFRHGQTEERAKANFRKAIDAAGTRYASLIRTVEWSPDRASARLVGQGFDVDVRLTGDSVRATGRVPLFARLMLEAPVRKFLEETFREPGAAAG